MELVSKRVIKVAILSPRPSFRDELGEVLSEQPQMHVQDRPVDLELALEDALAWIRQCAPEVVLYDADPLYSEPIETLIEVKRSGTKVLLVFDDPVEELVVQCVRNGADGYLRTTASAAQFVQAVYSVCDGELWLSRRLFAQVLNRKSDRASRASSNGRLTRREHQIVELVSQGMSNREIAERLLITQTTVKAYLNDIFRKLGVHGRVQLLVQALKSDRPAVPGHPGVA
jgi:DNA-binding NarL/FixJ family response regulator